MKKTLPVALALLALAGCGKEGGLPGVTAKNESSATVEEKASVTREKSITTEDKSRATVTVPAAPLLVDAIRAVECRSKGCQEIKSAVEFATTPCMGLPYDLDDPRLPRFAKSAAARVQIANELLTELAELVGRSTIRDPAALGDVVASRIGEADVGFDHRVLKKATLNLSGKQKYPVEVIADDSVIGCDQNGWHISRSGVVWFGEGTISGKKVELALESSLGTGLTKKADTSASSGASNSANNAAEVNLK